MQEVISQLTDAIAKEQTADPRPIYGIRVNTAFLHCLHEAASTLVQPKPEAAARNISPHGEFCGLPLFLGVRDEIEFLHSDKDSPNWYENNDVQARFIFRMAYRKGVYGPFDQTILGPTFFTTR